MARILFMDEFGRLNHKATAEIAVSKNKSNLWKDIFHSGYSVSDYSTGDPEEMKYKGRYYSFENRMAVEADVCETDRMKICYLYALSRFADAAGIPSDEDIEVIMGETAPVDNVGRDTQRYAQYFENDEDQMEMTIFHDTVRYFHTKKCFTLPEGAVAFAPYNGDCEESDVVVIDLGSRTMNVIVWHKNVHSGKWEMNMHYTDDVGSILLLNSIKRRLRLEKVTASEDMIEAAVYGKKISTSLADVITKITNEATDEYIREKVIGSLIEHLVDTTLPVFLCGGAGDMLYSRLNRKLNISKNLGVFANAVGGLSVLKTLEKAVK